MMIIYLSYDTLHRRDRAGRRGGAVAVYASHRLQATVWNCPNDTSDYELLWIRVQTGSRDEIERVSSLTALGVVINDQMTAADHVSSLLASCSRLLYALRVLRGHGIPAASMNDIFRSTVIVKLLYCAPAWSRFCSAKDRTRLDAFLRRCRRLGYCGSDISTVAELFDEADETLFH